jgi:hypothetical protein
MPQTMLIGVPEGQDHVMWVFLLPTPTLALQSKSIDRDRRTSTLTVSALACTFFGLFSLVFGLSSLWIRGRVFLTSSVLAMTFGEHLRRGFTERLQLIIDEMQQV